MAAVVAVVLALYAVVCADFVNFLGSSAFYRGAGIDVKDPRFLGTHRRHSVAARDCHVDAAALPARSARLCCRRHAGGDFRFCPANPVTGRLGRAGVVGVLVDRWSAGLAARPFAAVALRLAAIALGAGADRRSRRSPLGAALGRRNSASALPRAGRCAAAYVLAGPAVVAAARARMGQEIRRVGEWRHRRCDARAGGPHRHHEIAARGAAAISQPRRRDQADRAREIQPDRVLRHSAQRSQICGAHVFHRQAGASLAFGAAVLWRAFSAACRSGTR